jgi:hypothetical protein
MDIWTIIFVSLFIGAIIDSEVKKNKLRQKSTRGSPVDNGSNFRAGISVAKRIIGQVIINRKPPSVKKLKGWDPFETEVENIMQQLKAGVKYFEWDTARDERVCDICKNLNGKIFRWDDPENWPIIDKQGNRGLPGQAYCPDGNGYCRCTSLAVFVKLGYKMEQLNDGSWKMTKKKNRI